MKKAFGLIIAALILASVGLWIKTQKYEIFDNIGSWLQAQKSEHRSAAVVKIDDAHIYLFYQNRCPHCHHAMAYIKEKYPNLAVEYRDIAVKENWPDFLACAKKFNVPEDQLGTPLICMGENVIMGWSEKAQNNFDEYVKPFVK